jgi:hypothetical protein
VKSLQTLWAILCKKWSFDFFILLSGHTATFGTNCWKCQTVIRQLWRSSGPKKWFRTWVAICPNKMCSNTIFNLSEKMCSNSNCNQGCQMGYFLSKSSNLGKFWRALILNILVYFMAIWNMYMYSGHLVLIYVWPFVDWVVFWYKFPSFGILYHEKSGNPVRIKFRSKIFFHRNPTRLHYVPMHTLKQNAILGHTHTWKLFEWKNRLLKTFFSAIAQTLLFRRRKQT